MFYFFFWFFKISPTPHPVPLAPLSSFSPYVSVSVFSVHFFFFLDSAFKWNHVVSVDVRTYSPSILAWCLLGPSVLMQMARSHAFLWLSNIPPHTPRLFHSLLSLSDFWIIIFFVEDGRKLLCHHFDVCVTLTAFFSLVMIHSHFVIVMTHLSWRDKMKWVVR